MCVQQGLLTPGLHWQFCLLHYVGISAFFSPRLCGDCGSEPFQNYPAGRCWICLQVIGDSDWNNIGWHTYQVFQIFVNPFVDYNPVTFREVDHNTEPPFELFFWIELKQDEITRDISPLAIIERRD